MGAGTAVFASASPALALFVGFVLVILGIIFQEANLLESGWGSVTIGMIVEIALPFSRRLR